MAKSPKSSFCYCAGFFKLFITDYYLFMTSIKCFQKCSRCIHWLYWNTWFRKSLV